MTGEPNRLISYLICIVTLATVLSVCNPSETLSSGRCKFRCSSLSRDNVLLRSVSKYLATISKPTRTLKFVDENNLCCEGLNILASNGAS